MIIEEVKKKVNPKKIIEISSWIMEVDKIARQKLVHGGQGSGCKGSLVERWEKRRIRNSLVEWDVWK